MDWANCACIPTATAISPSRLVTTCCSVGAFGFARLRSHAAAEARSVAAATPARRAAGERPAGRGAFFREWRSMVASSVVEVEAGDELPGERRVREVDASRDRVLGEQVDLGVEAAVVR